LIKADVRKIMGTEAFSSLEIKTEYFKGVKGINASLIDWPQNPYKTIFELAVATWGNEEYPQKWRNTSLKGRKLVLQACLSHQTLTQALEAPKFTWQVRGVSRSAFDQIARIRVGGAVASQGVRDNSRIDAGFRIPSDLWEDEELRNKIIQHVDDTKKLYKEILEKRSSWQSARAILPMGLTHNFYITMNYLAFQNQCSRRMMCCEQADTVAAFWLMWHELKYAFPVLAAYCRPACDLQKKCVYHQAYTLSEKFSCLFKSCGRWPVEERESYFDYPSCTPKEIQEELGFWIPLPSEWEGVEKNAWKEDELWRRDF